jgi:hypothetical protein
MQRKTPSSHIFCVVPRLLTLYTHHWCMGKKNKIVKLTPRKIRYIIRYKTSIREVMTDHGTQFYANKRDKNGNADSRFEDFLERNKIVHILAPIKRPQVNGKIENGMIRTKRIDPGLIVLTNS